MYRTFIIFIILFIQSLAQERVENEQLQIGIFSLQSPPGTEGYQNGSLIDVKKDIEMVKGFVNAAIPYRHWNRADYPNWNYTGFVTTYIKDLFKLTYSDSTSELIQAFTPPLYSSFINPPVKSVPENDGKIDRNLDIGLFNNFVSTILKKEIDLVFESVDGDTSKFIEIMFNKKKRPLGGWYLDDEPLIRNHDIEVIESMAKIIRLIEIKTYYENSLFRYYGHDSLDNYLQNRYLAFDADDLHDYHLSKRKRDADFYYFNGISRKLEKENIYTVFSEDTYDILMLDFYHNDNFFWNNIILEAKNEFISHNREIPLIMPIVKGFKGPYDDNILDYRSLFSLLMKLDIAGLWFYSWIDSLEETIDLKENWNNEENNLKRSIIDLKDSRR
jgi:hypothetical protein